MFGENLVQEVTASEGHSSSL